jgi:tetratricopeptide (TPR) repeat protein
MRASLLIIGFCLFSKLSSAQDITKLIQRGDSLAKVKNHVKALDSYKQVITLILEDKAKLPMSYLSTSWDGLLKRAGQSAYQARRWDLAKTYWNMAYGTKAEKLADKILFLQTQGLTSIYSYEKLNNSNTYTMLDVGGCTSNTRKVLIWFQEGRMFLQLFTDCDTYRPINFDNKELADFYSNNIAKMVGEDIKSFQKQPSHVQTYSLEFFDGSKSVKKTFNIMFDLAPPTKTYSKLELETTFKHVLGTYEANKKAALGSLLVETEQAVDHYLEIIESGSEKLRVGKF